MNRRIASVLRAVCAGVLFGCGIAVGAHNGWVMALIIGVPLIVTGAVIAPRPGRITELPVWADVRPGVGARVEAVTRSTMGTVDRQPSLVTATVSPPDDTPYEARWLVSMSRSDMTAVLDDPRVELPDALVPARTTASTPEFDDVPGRRVLAYPLITLVVLVGLLAAVPGSAWHVGIHLSAGSDAAGATDSVTERRLDAAKAHAATLSPTAASNLLQISLSETGSDTVDVFDPSTGEVISAYRSGGSDSSSDWRSPTRRVTQMRQSSTFPVSDLDRFDLSSVTPALLRGAPKAGSRVLALVIKRPGPGQSALATATVGPTVFDEFDRQARLTGEVAELFDPGDLAASMRIAAAAMREATLSTTAPILTRFEIRGTREGTPVMRAGSIQNSGGVLIEYSTASLTGQVSIEPGGFPSSPSTPYENKAGSFPRGGVAFDRLSEATFTRIRDDAMRRGDVGAFDRTAVDLQVTQGSSDDDYGPIIFVAVGPSDSSIGTYSLAGDFLRPQTY